MVNPLVLFSKSKRRQEMKARVLKSREAVLEVFSENIEGVKPCPILLGEKCMGSMCTFFMELQSTTPNGESKTFWRCAFVETPLLLMELNRNILSLQKSLLEKSDKFNGHRH